MQQPKKGVCRLCGGTGKIARTDPRTKEVRAISCPRCSGGQAGYQTK